ncbi:MAG: radical SAM protein [Thermoleophilia bacterium]|nr:radical SAM protein [Thermoleophilia bacterium]
MVRLKADCSIKMLEEPCLYDRENDELYVVDTATVPFLRQCVQGVSRPDGEYAALVDYCLEEGLMEKSKTKRQRTCQARPGALPSLRYLLLHITDRCNLGCRHCFQGAAGHTDLPLRDIIRIVDQFEELHGLRLMVSGGEPMMHPDFSDINAYLAEKDVRTILLSNGTYADSRAARLLKFREVQISLDGARTAHDYLRGPGTFDRAVEAIKKIIDAGIQVSVATVIHRGNLKDFDYLSGLLRNLGVRQWNIDAPSPAGRLSGSSNLMAHPREAGPLLGYAYGGAVHEPASGYACGAHLMAVMANGDAARCGFYAGSPSGSAVRQGLADCWRNVRRMRLDQLACECQHIEFCRGGCRFRAAGYSNKYGPDPCQCYRYGVMK